MIKSWKEHNSFKVPCTRSRIEEIVRKVNGSGKFVLEVGCNDGVLSRALREDGCLVTSVDNDSEKLKAAFDTFGIIGITADINCLPFDDDSFDIAVGGEVLEHLDNPGHGLKELFRVAKEKVVISLPLGPYWLGEKTHKWCINAETIEHDAGIITKHEKELIVLEFIKK